MVQTRSSILTKFQVPNTANIKQIIVNLRTASFCMLLDHGINLEHFPNLELRSPISMYRKKEIPCLISRPTQKSVRSSLQLLNTWTDRLIVRKAEVNLITFIQVTSNQKEWSIMFMLHYLFLYSVLFFYGSMPTESGVRLHDDKVYE